MATNCDEITSAAAINLAVDSAARPARAYIHFLNGSRQPVWFPLEEEPSFQLDASERKMTVWFGYFDEIYGDYKGRYMLPPMRLVPARSHLDFEITSQQLLEKLASERPAVELFVRLATKKLNESSIRGQQPLEDYENHSCILSLPASQKTRQP